MLRVLTKNLDLNEILDLLAGNYIDTDHVYLEPHENSNCSEGYDNSKDEGHPTQIPRPILQVGKKFQFLIK